jgi:hypothetical protein
MELEYKLIRDKSRDAAWNNFINRNDVLEVVKAKQDICTFLVEGDWYDVWCHAWEAAKKEKHTTGITQEQLLWRIIDKLNEAINSQHETIEFLMGKRLEQRKWVGLTMLDMAELRQGGFHNITDEHFRAIEAALKEKNG